MNLHQFELECDVCGGPVWGTIRDAGRAWDPRWTLSHRDPRICRDYLDRERRNVEEQRREWARSLKPIKRLSVEEEQRRLAELQANIDTLRRKVLSWPE